MYPTPRNNQNYPYDKSNIEDPYQYPVTPGTQPQSTFNPIARTRDLNNSAPEMKANQSPWAGNVKQTYSPTNTTKGTLPSSGNDRYDD